MRYPARAPRPAATPASNRTADQGRVVSPAACGNPGRRLSSDQLFDGMTEIEIQHGPFVYRLRLTSLGKLILTK